MPKERKAGEELVNMKQVRLRKIHLSWMFPSTKKWDSERYIDHLNQCLRQKHGEMSTMDLKMRSKTKNENLSMEKASNKSWPHQCSSGSRQSSKQQKINNETTDALIKIDSQRVTVTTTIHHSHLAECPLPIENL